MAAAPETKNHIVLDEHGRPCIAGTRMRVAQLATEHTHYGWTAEELYVQHYRAISMAQIYAALSYYYDHQTEVDAQIESEVAEIDRLRAASGEPPFVARMRREGRLK